MLKVAHTPGPWRVGKSGGSVVADVKSNPRSDDGDLGYYGGYLVAESMTKANADVIVDAPAFAEVLGHPGFRSLELVKDVGSGAWQFRVVIDYGEGPRSFDGYTAAAAVRDTAQILANIRAPQARDLRDRLQQEIGRALVPVRMDA